MTNPNAIIEALMRTMTPNSKRCVYCDGWNATRTVPGGYAHRRCDQKAHK